MVEGTIFKFVYFVAWIAFWLFVFYAVTPNIRRKIRGMRR